MAYDEDYYKKLQEEDYNALLKSEMQLEASRQRALKNTQTSLDTMGMGSSGFGSTARAGIEGQYMQGLQSAQDRYANAVSEHKQEYNDFKTSELEDYISNLNLYEGNNEAMYNRLAADGYGTYENGQWTWNEEKLAGMNPSDVSMLKQGITGLDYSNVQVNQGYVSNYISSLMQDMSEEDDGFANKLLSILTNAGVITEETDGTRQLHLDKILPQDRDYINYFVKEYNLLSPTVTASHSDVYYDPESYFTKAYQIQNKNSNEYYSAVSQGYNDVMNGHWSTRDAGNLREDDGFWITIGSNGKLRLRTNGKAAESVSAVLDRIYEDSSDGDLAYYNGKLYVYSGKVNSWLNIKDPSNKSGNLEKAINQIQEYAKNSLGYDPMNPVKTPAEGEEQPTEQPVEQPVEQPTEQPVEQPVEEPTEETVPEQDGTPQTAEEIATQELEQQQEEEEVEQTKDANYYFNLADNTADKSSYDYKVFLGQGYTKSLDNLGYKILGMGTGRNGDTITVKIDKNNKFTLRCGKGVDSSTSKILERISPNADKGTVVVYDGNLYIKGNDKKGWRYLKGTNLADTEELLDYIGKQSGRPIGFSAEEQREMELSSKYLKALTNKSYVQGMGTTVRNNNDIDITIGSNKRNKKSEFDLKMGNRVKSSYLRRILDNVAPEAKKGQLVVYDGKLYLFTGRKNKNKRWVEVKSDRSKVDDAITAIKQLGGI